MFKTRIELRQIGVRDETKIVGGIGGGKCSTGGLGICTGGECAFDAEKINAGNHRSL